MAVVALGLGCDRFTVRNGRQLRYDLEIVTVLDLLQNRREVQFAQATQDDFVERHDVFDEQ